MAYRSRTRVRHTSEESTSASASTTGSTIYQTAFDSAGITSSEEENSDNYSTLEPGSPSRRKSKHQNGSGSPPKRARLSADRPRREAHLHPGLSTLDGVEEETPTLSRTHVLGARAELGAELGLISPATPPPISPSILNTPQTAIRMPANRMPALDLEGNDDFMKEWGLARQTSPRRRRVPNGSKGSFDGYSAEEEEEEEFMREWGVARENSPRKTRTAAGPVPLQAQAPPYPSATASSGFNHHLNVNGDPDATATAAGAGASNTAADTNANRSVATSSTHINAGTTAIPVTAPVSQVNPISITSHQRAAGGSGSGGSYARPKPRPGGATKASGLGSGPLFGVNPVAASGSNGVYSPSKRAANVNGVIGDDDEYVDMDEDEDGVGEWVDDDDDDENPFLDKGKGKRKKKGKGRWKGDKGKGKGKDRWKGRAVDPPHPPIAPPPEVEPEEHTPLPTPTQPIPTQPSSSSPSKSNAPPFPVAQRLQHAQTEPVAIFATGGTAGPSGSGLNRTVAGSEACLGVGGGSGAKPTTTPLTPLNIIFDPSLVRRLDIHSVPTAARWFLATKYTSGEITFDELSNMLKKNEVMEQLEGTNSEVMPKIREVFGRNNWGIWGRSDVGVWKQLDLEAAAREEGLYRGLGCFTGSNTFISPTSGRETVFPASGWHSGRVEFKATIVTLSPAARSAAAFASNQSQTHTLKLHKPRLGRSSMLSRVVDSEDYVVIKPSKPSSPTSSLQKEKKPRFEETELALLRTRFFVIFDKAYALFCGKEDGAYLVSFKQRNGYGMGSLMRFAEAMRAFNDPGLNSGQLLSKWANRQELLFSTSKPVIRFKREDVFQMDDIRGDGEGASSIKTDGHGYANCSFFYQTARILGITERFTTVQGRVYGSKGLWSLRPECQTCTGPSSMSPTCSQPKIWIRASQTKIKFAPAPSSIHPANLVFNLVRIPHVSQPTISSQVILNFSSNGIPNRVLINAMCTALETKLKPLTKWDPQHLPHLVDHVCQTKQIVASRMRNAAVGQARVFGYSKDDLEVMEDVNVDPITGLIDPEASDSHPEGVAKNPISGYPFVKSEKLVHLLQAGFQPRENPVIRDLIKNVIDDIYWDAKEKCTLYLERSWQAMIIPDPLEILEEGEIYFHSSKAFETQQNWGDVLEGDVLLWRNPLYHQSDAKKYRAVNKPDLSHWFDVIVMSVKGKTSAASIHSGGDYDGDYGCITTDPDIVQHFKGPRPVVIDDLTPERELPGILTRNHFKGIEDEAPQHALAVQAFSLGCTDSRVGLYSNFWQYAAYTHGYESPDAVRLGIIANIELDSKKQGRPIRDKIFFQDQRRYGAKIPSLLSHEQLEELFKDESPSKRKDIREKYANHHVNEETDYILEVLRFVTEKQEKAFWKSHEEREGCHIIAAMDQQCFKELMHIMAVVSQFPREGQPGSVRSINAKEDEVERLKKHIASVFDEYKTLMANLKNKTLSSSSPSSNQSIVDLAKRIRQYPEPALKHLSPRDIEQCIALSAYKAACPGFSGYAPSHYEFPFHMAFSTLAALKAGPAMSSGGAHTFYLPHTSLHPPFGDYSIVRSKLVNALEQDLETL